MRPGYGLYDRALGIMYMLGIWDMLDKLDEQKKEAEAVEDHIDVEGNER